MRRRLLLTSVLTLSVPVSAVFAQAAPEPTEPAPAAEPAPAEPSAEPAEPAEPAPPPAPAPAPEGEPRAGEGLAPPQLAPLDLEGAPGLNAQGPVLTPDPGDSANKLEAIAPPAEKKGWTASETVFHLHGYLRMRGTLLKEPSLGHSLNYDRLPTLTTGTGDAAVTTPRANYDPFPLFVPADRARERSGGDSAMNVHEPVAGGCGGKSGSDGHCKKKNLVSGDMRLRLKPEIHLSDDIRVKAWIDVLDNVGLGTMGYGPNEPSGSTAIRVRRAWGEARNRDIGELRFGRMGADWGLGILDNGGDRYGIDSDFSSDVDRIMGITNLAGFYLMAAYDWASEGYVAPGSATPSGVPIDRAQNDDTDAFTFAAARKLEPEAQQGALLRGESVFNYGVYFVYRDQLLKYSSAVNDMGVDDVSKPNFVRVNQTQYIPDLWVQFLWEGLRMEFEGAFVAGSMEGGCNRLFVEKAPGSNAYDFASAQENPNGRSTSGSCKFRQLGLALETEYRLFDEKLSLTFMSGFASGDANGYGLAATNDPSYQRVYDESPTSTDDRTVSTYQFHPDYRVDLILWRTIMRRVAGAYYFKPGLGYDFIHDPYGQVAGGRFDVIYSRAASAKQTYSQSSANLGLELDVSLYYRSEDGPDVLDGFYGLVQWGVLFPFAGLDYDPDLANAPSKKNAMIFRGVAGIQF